MTLLNDVELRERGFDVLVRDLGWVNAVRFIQRYERSPHDYTAQRDQILPTWNADEIVRHMASKAE